jgi:hypothetical protein
MSLNASNAFWGAHACSVLVSAFCRNELPALALLQALAKKIVIAKCDHQHATSVRSPEFGTTDYT